MNGPQTNMFHICRWASTSRCGGVNLDVGVYIWMWASTFWIPLLNYVLLFNLIINTLQIYWNTNYIKIHLTRKVPLYVCW